MAKKEKEKVWVQLDMFGKVNKIEEINKIEDHWINMPEYVNSNRIKPSLVVLFKFQNKDDFQKFNKVVRDHLYDGEQIFYNSLREGVKQAWYPRLEMARDFVYIDEDDVDQYLEDAEE